MTKIFESYSAFLNRSDWNTNGVSKEFAENNPEFEKQNETNKGCWNCSGCSDCSDCSGCSRCSDCSDCSRCSVCYDCSGCSDCYDCSDCYRCSDCSDCSRCSVCSDCSRCSRCSDCSRCSGLRNASPVERSEETPNIGFPVIPVIENIHQRVAEAVSTPDALNMESWHSCETTHCRAGWVVTLAGEQGKKLESATSTPFAAMQIYKASSPIRISPVRFYEDNKTAMADILKCAEEESKQN